MAMWILWGHVDIVGKVLGQIQSDLNSATSGVIRDAHVLKNLKEGRIFNVSSAKKELPAIALHHKWREIRGSRGISILGRCIRQ